MFSVFFKENDGTVLCISSKTDMFTSYYAEIKFHQDRQNQKIICHIIGFEEQKGMQMVLVQNVWINPRKKFIATKSTFHYITHA